MRTTLAVDGTTRDRLNALRRQWRLSSVDAVLHRLLDGPPETARALYHSRKAAVDAVLARHSVKRLVAFGSRARGDARPDSDLDLAVRLPADSDLFDLVHLKEELELAFGTPVDVVSLSSVKPRLKHLIEREGVILVG